MPERLRPRLFAELGTTIYGQVELERRKAHAKHDPNGDSMERLRWDDPAWLPVLVEEVGEVARVLCEQRHGSYNHLNGVTSHLRKELIQVAAMACAWIDAIDDEE
jgi:NTP pyrophosphatase (non-canonical NTP hydrolase)